MKRKFESILLVDDNKTANLINKDIIEREKISEIILVVNNAREGLNYLADNNKFKQQGGNYLFPELIFLDIMMPSMSGWQFLDNLKEQLDDQIGKIKVVMLTTSLNPKDKQLAKLNPFVLDIVQKPLTKTSINKILQKYYGN